MSDGFATFSANSGYWRVKVDKADKRRRLLRPVLDYTGFARMPFGLKKESGTFQRADGVTLLPVKLQYALIYLNDIVMFSRSPSENIAQVRQVLKLSKNAESL